jgi:hypothetical protein
LTTARRKPDRMPLRCEILVKGNLDTGNARRPLDCFGENPRRVAIALTIGHKQHNAVAAAAITIGKIPEARLVKPDHGIDPAGPVKIEPLIGEAQMHLDDGAADGFKIEHTGIAGEMFAYPGAAIGFDLGLRLGVDRPIVKGGT